MRRPRRVMVTWFDAYTDPDTSSPWRASQEAKGENLEVTTCGYMVKTTKTQVVLAQTYCMRFKMYCNTMTIPRGCIKSIDDLLCKGDD